MKKTARWAERGRERGRKGGRGRARLRGRRGGREGERESGDKGKNLCVLCLAIRMIRLCSSLQAFGVFGLCQIHAFIDYLRSKLSQSHFDLLFKTLAIIVGVAAVVVGGTLTFLGSILTRWCNWARWTTLAESACCYGIAITCTFFTRSYLTLHKDMK